LTGVKFPVLVSNLHSVERMPPNFNKRPVQSALLSTLVALQLLLTNSGAEQAGIRQAAISAGPETLSLAVRRGLVVFPFDPNNFSAPTKIDNQWLPLIPGTALVPTGASKPGRRRPSPSGDVLRHDLTKVINGVRTVVVWDRDVNDGQLVESELAFFAQDNDGRVWNLGEYP
jgi:hypothetical protein